MTDNDIIKALECDAYERCEDCPYYRESCTHIIDDEGVQSKDILDLINRQKAEIERLETNCLSMAQTMPNMAKAERAEAVKEFAERLKEKAWHGMWETINHVDVDEIDNLVKEMVGDG